MQFASTHRLKTSSTVHPYISLLGGHYNFAMTFNYTYGFEVDRKCSKPPKIEALTGSNDLAAGVGLTTFNTTDNTRIDKLTNEFDEMLR